MQKKGIGMNVKQENTISMEQLRKLLHISGRKASWMLRNGVIPCENRGCAAHTFIILMEDVEAYLAKPRRQRKKEIPVGGFNAKPIHIELHPEYCLKLRGAKRKRFIEYLEELMAYVSDALTVNDAATVIGLSQTDGLQPHGKRRYYIHSYFRKVISSRSRS